MEEIYFGKTRDVVGGLRSIQPLKELKERDNIIAGINEGIKATKLKSVK